jgi:D-alanine-D-alanine ligase
MMLTVPIPDQIIRPPKGPTTRILFIASHAPLAPAYLCQAYPGDGRYPAYYHRIWEVLTGLGYKVQTATQVHAVLTAKGNADLVFSLCNRMPFNNPEIFVASACEFFRIPSLGARPNTRALAEDKWFTKLAAQAVGIPVADGAVYGRADELAPPPFPGPYFVKNRFGAASEGISTDCIKDDWEGAARVAGELIGQGMSVLVEAYAPGLDITVPVLGGRRPIMLGVVHPTSNVKGSILTQGLKHEDFLGYELFDAGAAVDGLRGDVTKLWDAAGPMDYCRLDFRFDPQTGRRTFLEFNLCCHIGRSSAITLAASQYGVTHDDVLGHVVEYSLLRQSPQ